MGDKSQSTRRLQFRSKLILVTIRYIRGFCFQCTYYHAEVLYSTQVPVRGSLLSLSRYLSRNEADNFANRSPESTIHHLQKDVPISTTIQVRSEKLSLVGNNSSLLFNLDIIQCSTLHVQSSEQQCNGPAAPPQFMFDVSNSTFSVKGIHANCNSGRNGLCSISASQVRTFDSEAFQSGSSVTLLGVTHLSNTHALPPLAGLLHPPTMLSSAFNSDLNDISLDIDAGVSVVGMGLVLASTSFLAGVPCSHTTTKPGLPTPELLNFPMCFVMNKIAISILDTQDILTVLNTFSFQRPFPQLRKAQCFPPSQAVKKEHICILVDQAPLPHVFTPLSPNLAFPPAIRGRQFPQQLTGQTHESSFQSRLCRAEYDWRLVNVNDNPTFPSDKDLKTLVEPAFRANNNKKVVLCGHNTYIFAVITSGAPFGGAPMADGSIHNQYSDADLRLSALDDPQQEHLRRRLRRCPASKAGKACVKTAVQRTRNNTDQPLVLPKVMTHVMYSIGLYQCHCRCDSECKPVSAGRQTRILITLLSGMVAQFRLHPTGGETPRSFSSTHTVAVTT
ncbi:hypothetical protein BLNAU_25157 [Blattamonas nauphoetae]|uniref:Uncharacterized protein n=1 Tax=Blattamonas nauphoetae TaxID=2049346 RepID=A0ABQ9WKS9_9EUKA|nr:hypothetical protein BLNAU_25157 [Blattamonas nauphoetae]